MKNSVAESAPQGAAFKPAGIALAPAGGGMFSVVPGLVLTAGVAALAIALREIPGMTILSPMILATLIGMVFHNVVGTPAWATPGVKFSLKRILRLGIILLGLQLMASQVVQVGLLGGAVIAATLLSTFVFTKWLGRVLGVDRKLTELIAAGTSICGASAVIATNTVTEGRDEDVAYAVACVTVFGSLSMFIYPMLPGLLHLGPEAYGLWTGASIHEIAQVVAAAFQEGAHAGEIATVSKLTRVMMLAPLVIGLGVIATRRAAHSADSDRQARGPADAVVRAWLHRACHRQQRRDDPGAAQGADRAGDDLHAVHGAGGDGAGNRFPQAQGRRPEAAGIGRGGLDIHRGLCAGARQADRLRVGKSCGTGCSRPASR